MRPSGYRDSSRAPMSGMTWRSQEAGPKRTHESSPFYHILGADATMSKHIPLTQGKVATVDDEDYEWLSQWKWCYQHDYSTGNTGYAVRSDPENPARKTLMHRLLLDLQKGQVCDHINGDGLDNRRANLRPCSTQQNICNKRKRSTGSSSRFKGVSWDRSMGRWRAQISPRGTTILLGYYDAEKQAAKAYDVAAQEHYGEFAKLNSPSERS